MSKKQSKKMNCPWSLTRERTILWAWNSEVSSSVRGTSIKWQCCEENSDMILGPNKTQ